MSNFFRGRYYKHQNGKHSLSVIIGETNTEKFVQVITNKEVFQYKSHKGCLVSSQGIQLNYPEIKGTIHYGRLHPLSTHIMGPFHFLPMQCNHEVVSMKHALSGSLRVRGKAINFSDGNGYIEGDYGRSFPKNYLWIQCNDFDDELSIMVSIAHIPFLGFHFTGCICAILYKGKEYRLSTYKGVKVQLVTKEHIILSQGHYYLDIHMKPTNEQPLRSPKKGQMVDVIHESISCQAHFHFRKGKKTVFDANSMNCSYEYNY
jgi:hypothetical protein